MSRRKPDPLQADLFGPAPPRPKDTAAVTLPMTLVSAGTEKAWQLKPLGASSDKAAFAPRSEVKRGEGDRAQFFTMPRWIAADRGWL